MDDDNGIIFGGNNKSAEYKNDVILISELDSTSSLLKMENIECSGEIP